MTFSSAVGALFNLPLRAIIRACVALKIHPNVLTFTGVLISIWAGYDLARGHFVSAGFIMMFANIFDFIDGKVAADSGTISKFGGFWDSVIDRLSDLALSVGLVCLYASMGRVDYVLITSIAMVFATMTSYARARAECEIPKCKVGFMERPERIVLFMIGAFTNRMAAVMWVIAVLSIVTVANRVYFTYLVLENKPQPNRVGFSRILWRALYWQDDRGTVAYDLWVFAILAFVWITPPDAIGDPMSHGMGVIQWISSKF
jgi:CDP-diacylglycerol--glycerol-3-phosphate 3-phosphatidyltransferase